MPHPPIFSLSAHSRSVNSARQRFLAYRTHGKSYLSTDWVRTKPVRICRQSGFERSLFVFVSRLGLNEACSYLSADWVRTKPVRICR